MCSWTFCLAEAQNRRKQAHSFSEKGTMALTNVHMWQSFASIHSLLATQNATSCRWLGGQVSDRDEVDVWHLGTCGHVPLTMDKHGRDHVAQRWSIIEALVSCSIRNTRSPTH